MKISSQKSFTLVEIMVSVAIFSLVVAVVSGLLFSHLAAQRKVLALRTLLDESSYIMEYLSRAIRMAKKELNPPICLSAYGLNYEITRGGKGLKFKNYQGLCQEFFWDTTTAQLKEVRGGKEYFLTSGNLEVVSFNINLTGQSQWDNDQPRVTIFFNIKGKGEKAEKEPQLKIQTTVSQRSLDVKK